ncbi:MAG: helix-turn-helix domain-containing protein [Alphaproteobacteria bacterium]
MGKATNAKTIKHPVDEHVGAKLKSRRTLVGMSQEELGRTVGVTFQQIQKYEKGLNRIGCSRLFEISNVLKTSVSFFFEGLESNGSNNYNLQESKSNNLLEISNKEILSLVRAYSSIEDQQVRKKVISLVKSLSNISE